MDPLKWKAINGQVILRDDQQEEQIGRIILPGNVEGDQIIQGTVMSVSPFLLEDGRYMDSGLAVGNRVIYGKHSGAGNTYKDGNTLYRLARFNEVLAIVGA